MSEEVMQNDAEMVGKLAANLAEMSILLRPRMSYGRPLIGAVWTGNFWICSSCAIEDGFHVVTYYIAERDSGTVIGHGQTKQEALSRARWAISEAGSARGLLDVIAAKTAAINAQADAEFESMMGEFRDELKSRKTPQRRVDVFEKSDGACHYCDTTLQLAGNWHIEHMVPLARGGSDHISNLVASCAPCNLKKGTKTAEEFMASVTHV